MQFSYYSFTRFPSEKAHSLYIAKVSESFADISSYEVSVVVPRRFGSINQTPFDFYGVKNNFKVVKLPCIDLFYLIPIFKHITFYTCIISFSLSSLIYAIFKSHKESVIFANDLIVALFLTFSGRKIVYELHDYPQESFLLYKKLFKRVYKVQTNNYQKMTLLKEQFGVPEVKMYTAHNGVTIEDFDIPESRIEARNKLGLDPLKKLVIYTGHLYDWKGVDTLIETAKSMSKVEFIFIGGSAKDVVKKKNDTETYNNIQFLGFKPHSEIPLYQKAADVLVVPNTAKKDISKFHTSPMKIFEYMASRTLIVCSDIPSIKEILDDNSAIFFIPDNVESLKESINNALLLSSDKRTNMISCAYFEVSKYQWKLRAKKVISLIKS